MYLKANRVEIRAFRKPKMNKDGEVTQTSPLYSVLASILNPAPFEGEASLP